MPQPDNTWFRDAKFGLFMHFGLYSLPAGEWKGKKMGRNAYAEWIRYQWGYPDAGGIPKADYDTLIQQFNPTQFNADFIIKEAANAGMKYLVVTTKHHDGFAMWHSRVSKYSVDATPSHRDIIAELTAACRKYGLKVGFYYSHWLDWEYPGGGLPPWPELKADPEIQQPTDDAYEKYWAEKCLPQVQELIENFSPDLFWFDSWGAKSHQQITPARIGRLINLIRNKSPKTLINGRIGTNEGVDFMSTDDNAFPEKHIETPWETSGTMNHSWGYNKFDHAWRSPHELLRSLVNNASRNGNFQLNIGPRGDGSLEPAVLRRLRDLGAWTSVNADAIYGSRPVAVPEPKWGRLTQKGNTIYAHVYDWPIDLKLQLPNLPINIMIARVLETEENLRIEAIDGGFTVTLPKAMPDDRITVIALVRA